MKKLTVMKKFEDVGDDTLRQPTAKPERKIISRDLRNTPATARLKVETDEPKAKKKSIASGPSPLASAVVAALLLCVFALNSLAIISPPVAGDGGYYSTRILWNLAASTSTNRIHYTNNSAAFGDTNLTQLNIRSNTSNSKWEWRSGTTVIATNTGNRVTGTWKTNGVGAAVYGYTRYEPTQLGVVHVDVLGGIVDPANFLDVNNLSDGSEATNLVFQGRPYYPHRRYDVMTMICPYASWTRSGTTATVSFTAHGLTTGNTYVVKVSSDNNAITQGNKTVTVVDANTLTFTCLNAGSTSGSIRGGSVNDSAVDGYFFQSGANSCSNLFYGGASPSPAPYSMPFTYTNTAGYSIYFDANNTIWISNATPTLLWSVSPGTMLVHPNLTTEWTKKLDGQGVDFGLGTKYAGATAKGPQFVVTSYYFTNASSYPKVVVFEGDSRSAGWNQSSQYGAGYMTKGMVAHPFFRNAYFTNLAQSGNTSLDVSNRYASTVYPLRPQNGQVGYYIVWTGANGDTPTTILSTLQPLYKKAKQDGWTVVAVTSPPTPAYGYTYGDGYGEGGVLINRALRSMNGANNGASGENGCWDILVDLEAVLPNLMDRDVSTDGLHPVEQGVVLKIGEYIAKRIAEGTMTDGHGINVIPPLTIGTFYQYGVSNVVYRAPTNYQNHLFKGVPLVAGDGLGGMTNQNRLPPIPQSPGEYFVINTLGLPQLVTSGDGVSVGQTWTKTNQLTSDFAIFQRILVDGGANPAMPSATWTNILFTTNIFSGQNFDNAGAFTLSNSFIIVNAAGAGRWEVSGRVTIYDGNSTAANCTTRVAIHTGGGTSTLIPGEGGYGPLNSSYGTVNLHTAGVVILSAGDIISLQARASSATWEVGKNVGVINMGTSSATLKLRRF